MRRTRKYRIVALALLAATIALLLTAFPAAMNSARLVGLSGQLDADGFQLRDVESASPAAVAGLRPGDRITALDGRAVHEWHDLYRTRLSEYLAWRIDWTARPVDVAYLRADDSTTTTISVRPLWPMELVSYFGARLAIVVILISLTVFMLACNPKDPTALVVSVCFFAFICWMGVDRPGWPRFLSPLVSVYSPLEFQLRDLTITFAMQLALSAIIHVMLVFPRRLLPPGALKLVLPAVWVIPSAIMAFAVIHYAGDGLINRMTDLYVVRLWLDSSLLILAAVLIVINSRRKQTGIQKEQSRWVLRSVVTFTVIHVAFWNLPKLLAGMPILPSYNWMLMFVLLIPIALTGSITNHHLFGIRGLVRRRIRYLDTLARRHSETAGRRDQVIHSLSEEIEQLRDELQQYVESEDPVDAGAVPGHRLLRLERQYPEIREARHSSLVGRSAHWEQVFEDAVLASRGDAPVLILGESGTGKTQLARVVHVLSDRSGAVYREISCAQFEHADPAFALGKLFGIGIGHGLTNAPREGRPGLLEECDGGVLFLDDFDRLPLNAQDLLLYPLEGKPFEPGIGTGPPRSVSVKFILATNRDPDALVEQGELRADVLARMSARVSIPPLRDRPEDIPLLVERFVAELGPEFAHEIESISTRVMNLLRCNAYGKGNVRELRTELRTAIGKASLHNDPVLRARYLSEDCRAGTVARAGGATDTGATRGGREAPTGRPASDDAGALLELEVLRRHSFRIGPSEEELGLSHKSKTLSNHLRGRCLQALADHDWDPEAAARELVGSDETVTIARVQRKMSRYLQSVRQGVVDGQEQRLFNNLPAAYHGALTAAIRHCGRR